MHHVGSVTGQTNNVPIVRTDQLVCGVGRTLVVPALDLEVPGGEAIALMGQNGTGKTTLLRTLAGILRPLGGRLDVLAGGAPAANDQLRAKIGYLPQQPTYYPGLTVVDHLRLVAGLRHLARERVEHTLERFELTSVAGRTMGRLSGGFRQRVMVALALMHGPRLVLLDEPGTAMDPRHRELFFAEIRQRDPGRAVVFATHRIEEGLDEADRILVFQRGRSPTVLNTAADETVIMEFEGAEVDVSALAPGRFVEPLGENRFRIRPADRERASDVVGAAVAAGLSVRAVQSSREAAIAELSRQISEGLS